MKILCTKVKKKFQKTLTISKVRPDSEKNAIKRFEPGLRNGSKNKKVFSNVCFSQNWDTLRNGRTHFCKIFFEIFLRDHHAFLHTRTILAFKQGWPKVRLDSV